MKPARRALLVGLLLLTGAARAEPRRWTLDPAASRLRILAFRAGALARLGHHHILQAGEASGLLQLPEQGLNGASGEIRVPLAALQIDDPAWRREAGGEFDEGKPVSEDDIAATRRNLLASLRAAEHPEVVLRLLQLGGAAPWWWAELSLQLAGVERPYRVGLQVERGDASLRTHGRLVLRQSDHGLTPYSVLGGLLAVQDEVVLEFNLAWR